MLIVVRMWRGDIGDINVGVFHEFFVRAISFG